MRKHIYGFTLFVFIVACGVTAYAFFFARTAEINKDRTRGAVSEHAPGRQIMRGERLAYEIKSFTVDLAKNRGTVMVKFDWISTTTPPHGIEIGFGIVTADRPHGGSLIGWSAAEQFAFDESRTETRTFTFQLEEGSRHKFDPEKTYYGFLHLGHLYTDFQGDDVLDKTRDFMYGSVPVLVHHSN